VTARVTLRVSHIVLDVDGTLVDFDASLRIALDSVARRATEIAGAPITRAQLLAMREAVRAEVAAEGAERTLRELRDESFRRVLRVSGVPDDARAAELSALYYESRDASLRPFPEVEAALDDLAARGFTLVAASNGNAALERLAIFRRFAHLHFAEAVGLSKPDPRFFATALERSGGRPEAAVSVGDRLENDYAPARAIGMHAVLVDRSGDVSDVDVVRIESLAELPGLVEPL
jgi:HAD superfamily hydrolase (TIGR01509 family)